MKTVKVRDTSMRAFLRIRGDRASYKQRIFQAILATGDEGLTSKEAELRTKIPHENASARVNELLQAGLLVRTGQERLNPSGQPAEILVVPKNVRDGEPAVPIPIEVGDESVLETLRAFALRYRYRDPGVVAVDALFSFLRGECEHIDLQTDVYSKKERCCELCRVSYLGVGR